MRCRVALVLLVATAGLTQEVVRPPAKVPTATPPAAGKVVPAPVHVDLHLPSIESVVRTGKSPGPAADDLLLNGEAIRIRGANLGSSTSGYTVGVRRAGKIVPVLVNRNVTWTATEIGAYVPGRDDVERAGLLASGVTGPFEIVLLDNTKKVIAAREVQLAFRRGPREDFDRDGQTTLEGDCNDFDARRFRGAVEVCDRYGLDEDCDPRTYGERDLDGDHFFDALCFNVDDNGKRVSGGNDCDDSLVTANPIRPENCPPGSGSP